VLDEPLQCPAQSKTADWGAGYETFAQNFVRFEELGCSPLKTQLPVDKLRLGQLLKENEAKWHKAYEDAFNNTKLQRAEKRKYNEVAASNQTSPVKRRGVSLSAATTNSHPKCFFCDETSGELHKASTFSLDDCVQCPQLPLALEHGNVYGSGHIKGDVYRFTCHESYSLVGQDALYCNETGRWNGSVPICLKGNNR